MNIVNQNQNLVKFPHNPNIITVVYADGRLVRSETPAVLNADDNGGENCSTILAIGQPLSDSLKQTSEALTKFLVLPKHEWFRCYLEKSFPPLSLASSIQEIQTFIDRDCGRKDTDGKALIKPGGRHAYYRSLRAFYNWAYSPKSELGLELTRNPIKWVTPPDVPKRIMPAQDEEKFGVLLSHVDNIRDRAVLSLLIDTSGRLSEVANINEPDILWEKHIIRAIAKGNREVLMPLGRTSEVLLKDWLAEYHPHGGSIWDINKSGIVSMLRRLERKSGIKCNAHTFRRGFASILRRRGVDCLDIMKLGHWKSLTMVQRYTESVSFEDSLSHYEAPTERLEGVTDGLLNNVKVPRPRIELGTRGFSVHQQHLIVEILTHLIAAGQAASQLLQAFGSNGHKAEELEEIKKTLERQVK